jgi:ferredoxin-type protein NapH
VKKFQASTLRTVSTLAFVALTAFGLAYKTGSGTLSVLGYKTISAVCPLGSIEVLLAGRTWLPRVLISLAILFVFAIILGRVFCAWICPVPLLRSWLLGRSKSNRNGVTATVESLSTSMPHPQGRPSRVALDSRHFVLGGALISTAIFGFPVFCLICPIGLTFATLIGLWRLIQFNEPTWTLLIFPAVLVLELVVVRKWCRKICPLGALLSLLSSLNVFIRPQVDRSTCLRTTKGVDCRMCTNACVEGIDLHHEKASQPLSECTKCRECSEACPVYAITFPLFKKKKEKALC